MKPSSENTDYTLVKEQSDRRIGPEIEKLVEGCLTGDRRSQKELFRRYKDTVLSAVHHLLGSRFDLDDVTQQVFISLFKSLASFQGLSSLDTWVYRITSKVCTDQLRKKYRKRKLHIIERPEDDSGRFEGTNDSTPHDSLEKKELIAKIYEALDKLTTEKRVVAVMYEIEGATLEEISDVIKKPVGTVKSRLFHARRELQKNLDRYLKEKDT